MKLLYGQALEEFERKVKELEEREAALDEKEKQITEREEITHSYSTWLHQHEDEVNKFHSQCQADREQLDLEIDAFKNDKEDFDAFVAEQKQKLKKTKAYLQKKIDELHAELAKMHDYKNEHDFFMWDCERLSEIATRRLHAYQSNRSLLIAYKAALKKVTAGYSPDQRRNIEEIIAENLKQAKTRYKDQNIEAKKWAKHIKTEATATDDIHDVDMHDGLELLQDLQDNECDGDHAEPCKIDAGLTDDAQR